jgi:hypothetical protein
LNAENNEIGAFKEIEVRGIMLMFIKHTIAPLLLKWSCVFSILEKGVKQVIHT